MFNNHKNYYFHQEDINDYATLYYMVREKKIDTIINFAAESHVDRSIENSDEFIETNINGTHTLLKLLHEFPIKKFVQISTDEVYGSLATGDSPFTENTPLAPNSPYAASKTAADLLCRSFNETYRYPIVITRCSNNYKTIPNIQMQSYYVSVAQLCISFSIMYFKSYYGSKHLLS